MTDAKVLTKKTTKLTCIAHRGGRLLGTENSLGTIEKALKLNVDAIEIDVWQVDGVLLVTHDRELGRVVEGNQRLTDLNSEQLKKLRHHDGSTVADLETVMKLVGDKARLNIELKGPDCAEAVAKLIKRFCLEENINIQNYIVSSFDHQQLHWLHKNAPEILRGVLIYGHAHDGIASCQTLQAYSYHPSIDFIDKKLINEARNLSLEVWPYTVNREDDFKEMLALGVTGVFTDDPLLLQQFNAKQ